MHVKERVKVHQSIERARKTHSCGQNCSVQPEISKRKVLLVMISYRFALLQRSLFWVIGLQLSQWIPPWLHTLEDNFNLMDGYDTDTLD